MWARLNRLFDAEDAWTRPLPENYLRADAVLALAMFACSAVGLEILRSMGVLGGESAPLRVEGAVNTQRLVWEVYMKDKETGSGFTRNTMSNNWVYSDNIRVSIDK